MGTAMGFGASRRKGISALAVIASCLGVYVVLATAFHWFVQPTIAKNQAVIADRTTPMVQVPVAAVAAATAASVPTEPPIRMVKPPSSGATANAAAAPAASDATEAPKPAPRRVVRAPRPERRAYNPWDNGWGGGGGNWGGNWGGYSNRSRGWF